VNEVVCGALMLAYERAGRWQEAVAVLDRAEVLGIAPNTIMFNTAMSALGKALQVEAAEALFARMPAPDAVSHETLIAAYGMSGLADKAEAAFERMRKAGGAARKLLAALCSAAASPPHVGAWCPGCGSLWTLPGQ
jgi:pentatricopeptide repeat protein